VTGRAKNTGGDDDDFDGCNHENDHLIQKALLPFRRFHLRELSSYSYSLMYNCKRAL
jgi:hypothetical protein